MQVTDEVMRNFKMPEKLDEADLLAVLDVYILRGSTITLSPDPKGIRISLPVEDIGRNIEGVGPDVASAIHNLAQKVVTFAQALLALTSE